MSASALPEPLEAFPIPDGAVLLDHWDETSNARDLAVAALQQELSRCQLQLPLGPELALGDPQRLLSINRFAVQLATAGLLADQVAVPQDAWRSSATAPQLVLAALVDGENGVVQLQGVLTGLELQQLLAAVESTGGSWVLDTSSFTGGMERLLTLVALLSPEALPRLALAAPPTAHPGVIAIADWLRGQLDGALTALGGQLLPTPAIAGAVFRSAATADTENSNPLAVLAIPLGLTPEGDLVTGEAARSCVETFQLLLIPSCRQSAGETPEQLLLQLTGSLQGDLLPDAITLQAAQGRLQQSATAEQSYALTLSFSGHEPIQVSLRSPNGSQLQLPPIQLPQ